MNCIIIENEESMNFNAYARIHVCLYYDELHSPNERINRSSYELNLNPKKMKIIIKAGAFFPFLLKQAIY